MMAPFDYNQQNLFGFPFEVGEKETVALISKRRQKKLRILVVVVN